MDANSVCINQGLFVSVIMCTRNRARYLRSTLDAFEALPESGGWELIIVDNGSDDGTTELLNSCAITKRSNCKILIEKRIGVACAQNTGILASKGQLLAFTDDDCYPSLDYIESIRGAFSSQDADFIGGRVRLYDPKDAPITILESLTPINIAPYSYFQPGLIHGANLIIKRDALERVGFFDESVGPGSELGSGNDILTIIKLVASGARGRYDPSVVVWHHHRRKPGDDVRAVMRRYDVSRGAAYYFGLYCRGTRMSYVWPTFRHFIGQLLRRRFDCLGRELLGAQRYRRILKRRR